MEAKGMGDKMTEQELNRKLAEWAGIKIPPNILVAFHYKDEPNIPNFTQSLDACFKWLVPKLRELRYYVALRDISKSFRCYLDYTTADKNSWSGEADTPALALCLAIEKLIDNE